MLASVDESDIGKVQVGQKAWITTDAFPQKDFRGEVVRIATQGENSSNVVTFEVKIEVVSPNKLLLKPEMTANIQIIAARKNEALIVQAEAVYRRRISSKSSRKSKQDNSQAERKTNGILKHFVQVLAKDGTVQEREVQVGIHDGVNIEITQGLQEGEQIIIDPENTQSRWRRNQDKHGPPPMMFGGRRGRK